MFDRNNDAHIEDLFHRSIISFFVGGGIQWREIQKWNRGQKMNETDRCFGYNVSLKSFELFFVRYHFNRRPLVAPVATGLGSNVQEPSVLWHILLKYIT